MNLAYKDMHSRMYFFSLIKWIIFNISIFYDFYLLSDNYRCLFVLLLLAQNVQMQANHNMELEPVRTRL
jgi:hypothetical protein